MSNEIETLLKGGLSLEIIDDIGVYILDGSAITLAVNRAYEDLTGLEKNDLVGLHAKMVEEKGFIDRSVSLIVKKRKSPICIAQKILKSRKCIFSTGNPIFDNKGNIVLIVISALPFDSTRELCLDLPEKYPLLLSETEGVVFKSAAMQQVLERAIRAAAMKSTILISGESGVGKDVLARIIHQFSPRRNKPFIKVNVTAIPEELFESELFGYIGGAFTGALKNGKIGFVQAASGGTLFLDEISELPLKVQVKLLRLLQNSEVTRLGSTDVRKVDVRFIAATNRDLFSMTKTGQFREDLFYRLNVVPIYIPPLRERQEDIYFLAVQILAEICKEYKIEKQFETAVFQLFGDYSWPGNVRELYNLIERLVVLYPKKQITKEHVLSELALSNQNSFGESFSPSGTALQNAKDDVEKKILLNTYRENGCDLNKTSKVLGVHRTTVMRKLRKFGAYP